MNEIACNITEEETTEIRNLFEKKMALENLAKIITPSENEEMYQRLVADYGITVHEFNQWWEKILKEYNLPSKNYSVDFVNRQLVCVQKG